MKLQPKCACGKPLRGLQETARGQCNECFAKQYEADAKADALTDKEEHEVHKQS